MSRLGYLLIILGVLFFSGSVLAVEPELPQPGVQQVLPSDAPLIVSEPSVLLTEVQFKVYLDQQVIAEKERSKSEALQLQLKDCLVRCEGCTAPAPGSSSFNKTSFIVGAVVGTLVGIAVTSAAAYGVYTLARNLNQPK